MQSLYSFRFPAEAGQALSLVALSPDFLFFCCLDQIFSEVWVSDADDAFCSFPSGLTCQVCDTLFSYHEWCAGSWCSDDGTVCELRDDVGVQVTLLVFSERLHGQEGFSLRAFECACCEVKLSACTADVSCSCGFGTNLSIDVHADAAVDGYEFFVLLDNCRVIDVGHWCRQYVGVHV